MSEDILGTEIVDDCDGDLDGASLPSGENLYLGYGIDILRATGPNVKNLKTRLLAHSVYTDPKVINMLIDSSVCEEAETLSEESDELLDVFTNMNISAQVRTGKAVPFFSGGLSTKFGQSCKVKQESKFYNAIVSVSTKKHSFAGEFSNDEHLADYMNATVLKDINNPKINAETLFSNYGTHMIKECTIGGSIQVTAIYNSSERLEMNSLKAALDASCAYVSAEVSTELSKEQKNVLAQTNIIAYCSGGKAAQMAGAISFSQMPNLLTEWGQSLAKDEKTHALAQVQRYTPIWSFAKTDDRKKYLEDEFFKLAETLSVDVSEYVTKVLPFELIWLRGRGVIKRTNERLTLNGYVAHIIRSNIKMSDQKVIDYIINATHIGDDTARQTGRASSKIKLIHNEDDTVSFQFGDNNLYLRVREGDELLYANGVEIRDSEKFILEPYGDGHVGYKIKSVKTQNYLNLIYAKSPAVSFLTMIANDTSENAVQPIEFLIEYR